MSIRRARALKGTALSGARRRHSLCDSYPVQAAENSRTRGPSDSPQRATRLARNHDACETNLSHYFARKSRLASKKPRSGLADDFRHLAVGWQSGGVPMRAFCLMVKSSEL